MAYTEQQLDGVNDATIELYAITDPAHRRRGVATALVRTALPHVAADGGTSLLGWTLDDAGEAPVPAARPVPPAGRPLQPGADRRHRPRPAAAVDRRRSRPGRRLPPRGVGGHVPRRVGRAARRRAGGDGRRARSTTSTGTRSRSRADQVRDRLRAADGEGFDVVTTLALAPDGSAAGASQLMASRLRPSLGRQGDTGVVAAHRGHGLGRWLKAENLRRALDHQPGIEVIETYNAESNPHMLAINVDMGFRPHRAFGTWQGSVADAADALGVTL